MKKLTSFKLLLLGLITLGSMNAFAQPAVNEQLEVGNYIYTVTKQSLVKNNSVTTGTVEMTSVAEGKKTVDDNNNLIFPKNGLITWTIGSTTYKYTITTMAADLFKDNSYDAKHAVIPATLTEIPTGAFNTLTNLYDLKFAPNSQVTKIGAQAFASTQIKEFDFSPCVKLEGLNDGVFVQTTTPGNNKNANITKIILPTSTAFKHINGAFRNLEALETIENLEDSWIRELVDNAFAGCKALKTLSLPGNDLQYISSKALNGSAIEDLKINVGTGATNGNPMKLLGGCTVAYVFREATQDYVYNYEGQAYTTACAAADPAVTPVVWDPANASTNLYGQDAVDKTPLRKLTIEGTLQGKICTNAFAYCDFLANNAKKDDDVAKPEFVVKDLQFGTKAQIETDAFKNCTSITSLTLNDINDNKLDAGEYTIEANAFRGCPIATLNLGNIMTTNAIGSQAFGIKLKNVTIKTIKAGAAAFEAGAAAVAGQEAIEAQDEMYTFTSWSAEQEGTQWAKGKVDIVTTLQNEWTVVKVTENTPYGGNITEEAANAFVGKLFAVKATSLGGVTGRLQLYNVSEASTTPDGYSVEDNGTGVYVEVTYTPAVPGQQAVQAQDKKFGAFVFDNASGITLKIAQGTGEFLSADNPGATIAKVIPYGTFDFSAVKDNISPKPVVTIGEIRSQGGVFEAGALLGKNVDKINFTGDVNTNGLDVAILAYGEGETAILSELTFGGAVKTNGIGTRAFANFTKLAKLSFAGLLSKEAVASGAFTGTGLVAGSENARAIGSKDKPFVEYTADLTDNDASENPFATDAFGTANDARIIYWSVTNPTLAAAIKNAIQQDVDGDDYEGETVNPKFNVYKWVAVAKEAEVVAHGFIVYTDNKEITLDKNTDPTLAWGRYDLGSFAVEKGKDAEHPYTATDMIITRYQTAKGVTTGKEYKVKVSLYGMYWDEDDFEKKSSVYMVPLEVIAGKYQIPCTNKHLIIAKVQNTEGECEDDQVLIDYSVGSFTADDTAEPTTALSASSVWEALTKETAGQGPVAPVKRIFEKAAFSWTNQELVDAVTNEGGAQNVAKKDLHVLLDPSVNAGFDIKRLVIERKTDGTGAYIGKNWYYALLNNYGTPSSNANILWLDYDAVTAIFGVKTITDNTKVNDGAIYNLQGIRVNGAKKGLYIMNGKKYVVK